MGGVLLTTYDMVRCNFKALRGDYNGRDGFGDASDDIITWDYIILDEVFPAHQTYSFIYLI